MKDKQTRELLKPSDYEGRMKRCFKGDVVFWAIQLFCGLVITLIFVLCIEHTLNDTSFRENNRALSVISAIMLPAGLGYGLLATVVTLRLVLKAVGRISAVTRGEYNIVLDTFLYEAREVRRRRFIERLLFSTIKEEEVYYFGTSGRYVLGSMDKNLKNYSMSGDKFYVFTMKKDPSKPILIYNARVYEIRECDSSEYDSRENII